MSKPSPRVLVIPFPAQGHVNPFMNLSHKLAQHGVKIIFVNSDFNHKRVASSSSRAAEQESLMDLQSQIRLVSIPDGLGPEDDRNDVGKLCRSMLGTMPAMLEKLIEDLVSSGSEICSVVADTGMGWALEVARKLGIKGAALSVVSAATFVVQYDFPNLIRDRIIDSDGFAIGKRTYQLSPSMPTMRTDDLFWIVPNDREGQKSSFDYLKKCTPSLDFAEWWVCNTTFELEPGTLSHIPKLQPIGPLLKSRDSLGQFWEEDPSCLNWLDQHPPSSVIYVAFGSINSLDSKQFQEVAVGLELTDRPFLWVVRPDSIRNSSTKRACTHEFKGSLGKTMACAEPPFHCLLYQPLWLELCHGWSV